MGERLSQPVADGGPRLNYAKQPELSVLCPVTVHPHDMIADLLASFSASPDLREYRWSSVPSSATGAAQQGCECSYEAGRRVQDCGAVLGPGAAESQPRQDAGAHERDGSRGDHGYD